jgi:hypothetical protein
VNALVWRGTWNDDTLPNLDEWLKAMTGSLDARTKPVLTAQYDAADALYRTIEQREQISWASAIKQHVASLF